MARRRAERRTGGAVHGGGHVPRGRGARAPSGLLHRWSAARRLPVFRQKRARWSALIADGDEGAAGVLLLELYTRDGMGTMVFSDDYEVNRPATSSDVDAVARLLKPLEENGTCKPRVRTLSSHPLPACCRPTSTSSLKTSNFRFWGAAAAGAANAGVGNQQLRGDGAQRGHDRLRGVAALRGGIHRGGVRLRHRAGV